MSDNQKPALFGRNLVFRVLSALVLLPLAVWVVWQGGMIYRIGVFLLMACAAWEWVKLAQLLVPRARAYRLLLAGAAYIVINFWALLYLRFELDYGRDLVLFILIMVWAVDTGAYFAGRLIGGPKLAPKISPSKTWAGAIGGTILAGLLGWFFAYVAGARLPEVALILAAPIAFLAQSGDLLESWLKRQAGLKDSSGLIPGHGGVLDRIDGLLLAVPVFTVFQAVLGPVLGWW